MHSIATEVTAIKKIERNAAGASARILKAAPGFLTYVILKNPSITGNDSCSNMVELMYALVTKSRRTISANVAKKIMYFFFK
jgi:hypothetical protein